MRVAGRRGHDDEPKLHIQMAVLPERCASLGDAVTRSTAMAPSLSTCSPERCASLGDAVTAANDLVVAYDIKPERCASLGDAVTA